MMTQDRINVDDVQFWMENGSLKVGDSSGSSCSLSAEEALELLDVLPSPLEDSGYQESDYTEEDYTGSWICVGR